MMHEFLHSFICLCKESVEKESKKFFENHIASGGDEVDKIIKLVSESFTEGLQTIFFAVIYPDIQSKQEELLDSLIKEAQEHLQKLGSNFLEKETLEVNSILLTQLWFLAKILKEKVLLTFTNSVNVFTDFARKFISENYAQYVLWKRGKFYKRVINRFCEFFTSLSTREFLRHKFCETNQLIFTSQVVDVITAVWPKNEKEEEIVFWFLERIKPVYESLILIESLTSSDRVYSFEDFFHGLKKSENIIEMLFYLKDALEYVLDKVVSPQNWTLFVKAESVLACALYSVIGLEKECLKSKILLPITSWEHIKLLSYIAKYFQTHLQLEENYINEQYMWGKNVDEDIVEVNEMASRFLKILRKFIKIFVENEDFFDYPENKEKIFEYKVNPLFERVIQKVSDFFKTILQVYEEKKENIYVVVQTAEKEAENLELLMLSFKHSLNFVKSGGLTSLTDLVNKGEIEKKWVDVVKQAFITSIAKTIKNFAYKDCDKEKMFLKEMDKVLKLANKILSNQKKDNLVEIVQSFDKNSFFSAFLSLSEFFEDIFEKAFMQLSYHSVKENKLNKLTTQVNP